MQGKLTYKQKKYTFFLYSAFFKGIVTALLTVFLYQFFYIESIRSSVEDSAFDTINKLALSNKKTDTNNSNVFILMIDDKYLKSQNLLDENNKTNYGYILPREYLSKIILSVDSLVSDIDKENYPSALFLDYDLSYYSNPNNKIASKGDLELLNTLKRERPYTIYLPMTSNYNFIYQSKDEKIQTLINESKIQFVSVGLTASSDGLSRRFYPYETYKDKNNNDKNFINIAIKLYADTHSLDINISKSYAQEKISLIENRIIFKEKYLLEDKEYNLWQSKWNNLLEMSANYPLDMIYEDDLKNSIFMVGATHHESGDTFDIASSSKEISGIEMHANALMTLSYLHGKLQRLPLLWSMVIVFFTVSTVDFLLSVMHKSTMYKRVYSFIQTIQNKWIKNFLNKFIPSSRDDFFSMWLILLSTFCLMLISYIMLLSEKHYWFNWLIPSMMSIPYLALNGIKKVIKKQKFKGFK